MPQDVYTEVIVKPVVSSIGKEELLVLLYVTQGLNAQETFVFDESKVCFRVVQWVTEVSCKTEYSRVLMVPGIPC